MTVSVLHVLALCALGLTAVAVAACVVHVRAAHDVPLRRRERALLVAVVLAVAANGVIGKDLAITGLIDMALLLAVVAPTLAAPARR